MGYLPFVCLTFKTDELCNFTVQLRWKSELGKHWDWVFSQWWYNLCWSILIALFVRSSWCFNLNPFNWGVYFLSYFTGALLYNFNLSWLSIMLFLMTNIYVSLFCLNWCFLMMQINCIKSTKLCLFSSNSWNYLSSSFTMGQIHYEDGRDTFSHSDTDRCSKLINYITNNDLGGKNIYRYLETV